MESSAQSVGEILCQVCNAVNDVSWAFCQQCGSPLRSQSAPPTPPGMRPTPQSIPFSSSPAASASLVPPTIVAPLSSAPTVMAQPSPSQMSMSPAPPTIMAQPPMSPGGGVPAPPTIMAQPSPSQMSMSPAPPTIMAQPSPSQMSMSPAPPTVMAMPAAPPTVVVQPGGALPAPPTVVAKPGGLPSPSVGDPPRPTGSINSVTCTSCGKINQAGSSFCAACGAPLPVEQTLFMAAPKSGPSAKLRLIQEGGGDGELFKIEGDEVIIGRNAGDIKFPHDGYMSGRHARIVRQGEQFVLIDENSRNGTFKKIDGQVTLKSGDVILIGKQLFRFEV